MSETQPRNVTEPDVDTLVARAAQYVAHGAKRFNQRSVCNSPNVFFRNVGKVLGKCFTSEHDMVRVTDDERLRPLSRLWEEKYGPTWQFGVRDGAFDHDGHLAAVFAVRPTKVLAFRKGSFSQTRYRFGS